MYEFWKDIKGFEGYYQVSNLGRVKGLQRVVNSGNGAKRVVKELVLKQSSDKDGYLIVNLKIRQKAKKIRVHRLVSLAFLPNTENKPQVNHKNGIKNDNTLENLEWATLSENRQHAYDTGLQNSDSRKGEKNNFNKLTKEDVIAIRKMYVPYKFTNKMIAEKYHVTEGCISSITSNKNWAWVQHN